MTDHALAEAIELAGGSATVEELPDSVPHEYFLLCNQTLEDSARHFAKILDEGGLQQECYLVLTKSASYASRVRPLGEDAFVILLPLGFVARVRVLSRLLLSYWTRDQSPRFIRSPLDDMKGDREAIPPLLRPLFLEENPEDYWASLHALDREIELGDEYAPDVRELTYVALLHQLCHEFTHILHGHFELLKRSREEELPISDQELRRGIEIDADAGAAAIALKIQHANILLAQSLGQPADQGLGWLRLVYAVTMIYAFSDAHRKFFGSFDAGSYNHPMVRCELFLEFAGRAIQGPEPVMELWSQCSSEGWTKCVQALENLTLDAMTGRFGKPDSDMPAPLHMLGYSAVPGGPTDRETQRKCEQANRLMWRVRRLLPCFDKLFASNEKLAAQVDDFVAGAGEGEKKLVGVVGANPDLIESLRVHFGADRVADLPAELLEPAEGDAKAQAALFDAREDFLETTEHFILILDGLPAILAPLFFSGAMLKLEQERAQSVMCVCDPKLGELLASMVDSAAANTGSPGVETLKSTGRLVFLESFHLKTFEVQMAEVRENGDTES